jgi:hypothetical protein
VTNAPDDLMAVRRYLLAATGLSGDSVGIVAGPSDAAGGGYHCGNDALAAISHLTSDYSKRESTRDRPGTNAASALDIGDFTHNGVTLRSCTLGLVAACQRGDPRTRDIREMIYSLDDVNVHRWDRLGIRSTGDSSHTFHTHWSFFRDSEGRRAQPDNILGLLAELIEGRSAMNEALVEEAANIIKYNIAGWLSDLSKAEATRAAADETRDNAILATIKALTAGGTSLDTAAVIAEIHKVGADSATATAALHTENQTLRAALADMQQRFAAAGAALAATAPPTT